MPFKAKIKHGQIYWDSLDASMAFRKWSEANEGANIEITLAGYAPKLSRTEQQNRALHKYFELVADALNSAGFSVQKVLREHTKIEMPWTKEGVKEILWRTVQKRLLGKTSTTELSKQEDIDKVYDVVNRFLAEHLKVENIPFPSHEPGFWDTAPLKSET